MALKNLLGIAFPVIILFGIFLWLSVFSSTYKHSEHLENKQRRLTGIFNATLISLVITDAVYIAMILVLRNL